MAITKEKKVDLVNEYVEKLQRSQTVIVAEYRGLRVKQLQELRRELRGPGGEVVVAKNTLISRALTEVGMPAPETLFNGPTAVAFVYGDVAGVAKAMNKFAKDTKILVVKGGLMGQSIFDESGVQTLSELPSREVLLAQLLGTIQAPIAGLVNVLAGTVRGLVNVLNARSQQMEEQGATPS